MAGEDFYAGEDLEAILAAIDEDILDKDGEFNAEINSLLVNIEEEPSHRLHPLYFNKYINDCAKQPASDGCYSDETIETFCPLDDANFTYQFVRDVI